MLVARAAAETAARAVVVVAPKDKMALSPKLAAAAREALVAIIHRTETTLGEEAALQGATARVSGAVEAAGAMMEARVGKATVAVVAAGAAAAVDTLRLAFPTCPHSLL